MSTPINWQQLFAEIEKQGKVPSGSSQLIGTSAATFQAMYLDLGVIKEALRAADAQPLLTTIYADVLNIPSGLSWRLRNQNLAIFARRIEAGANVQFNLDFRDNTSASLVIFANELSQDLAAIAVTGKNVYTPFTLSAAGLPQGVQFLYQDGAPAMQARSRAQGMQLSPSDLFVQALSTEFSFASLLYDQQPALALAMFTWIKDWAGESPELLDMFLRSSSLVAILSGQVNAQKNGAAFVPYLTQQVYTDMAAAFVAEAQQYERDYLALGGEQVVTDSTIGLANTLLDNQVYQNEYLAQLLGQAQANHRNAVLAAQAAKVSFNKAQRGAVTAKIDFETIGIPQWETQQIIQAVISLGTAAITFGVGIAGMLVGDEAAGAASASAAITTAKTVANAAETESHVATMAKELAEVMSELQTMVDALNNITEFSKAVVEAADDVANAQSYADDMKQMDVGTGGADLSATYQWQIYQLKADAALKDPVELGVPYADELKVAVDCVAIYGQKLAAAQLAVLKAGQNYASLQLQKELATAQQARLTQYVAAMEKEQALNATMMQLFYHRYLDAKASLFVAIQGYRASYFYWALEPSTIAPRLIDDVGTMDAGIKDLTAVALDKANALDKFFPAPQTLRSAHVIIDDAEVLEALRKNGYATWTIPIDETTFSHYDRVRLTRVRVWLENVKPKASGLIHVQLTTGGGYLDRFQNVPYQFTSRPLRRDFAYRVSDKHSGDSPEWRFDDGTYGSVVVDGSVDSEVSYAYFEPTPFAQWTVSIKSFNAGIDLSPLTKITMEFAGSVIPQVE